VRELMARFLHRLAPEAVNRNEPMNRARTIKLDVIPSALVPEPRELERNALGAVRTWTGFAPLAIPECAGSLHES